MSDAKPIKRNANYYDVQALPTPSVGELVDGDLYSSPRPAALHSYAASQLTAALISRLGDRSRPGGWLVLAEPELHLGSDVVVPDLAAWRTDRAPRLDRDPAFLTVAPDWVCEALSPSTADLDRTKKMRVYARAGVGHAWLVDARARTLEVHRLEGSRFRLIETLEGSASVGIEPFEGISFELERLWPRPSAQ